MKLAILKCPKTRYKSNTKKNWINNKEKLVQKSQIPWNMRKILNNESKLENSTLAIIHHQKHKKIIWKSLQ